jgi:hypothetical protein
VATSGPTASTPQGARHQHLHLRWWSLSDLPLAPPRGLTIDVFTFGGGHYQTCRQHPLGGLPSTSSTLVVAAVGHAATTPRGPAIDVFNFGGGHCRTYRQHPLEGPPSTSSPPRGPPPSSMFLNVDGGCSRIFRSNWPHLRVRSLSRCGPGGICWYPEDRVPPHISSKSRQEAGCASMRYHVSCSFRPHLPTEVRSGATTCPTAPDLVSVLR